MHPTVIFTLFKAKRFYLSREKSCTLMGQLNNLPRCSLFILLPCLMLDDFTCERESCALYWVSNIQYIYKNAVFTGGQNILYTTKDF